VGSSLWREDGYIVYNGCWSPPAQSFSGQSPIRLVTIFYCLRFETSLLVTSYDMQVYGWRYSTQPPHEIQWIPILSYPLGTDHAQKTRPLYCCMAKTTQKTRFSTYFWHVIKGGVYRPSHRKGGSSIVACIRCRENVYGHSFIVIERTICHNISSICGRVYRMRGKAIYGPIQIKPPYELMFLKTIMIPQHLVEVSHTEFQ
jgi:hypothetical protein